jgi:hypothetical protein
VLRKLGSPSEVLQKKLVIMMQLNQVLHTCSSYTYDELAKRCDGQLQPALS